MSRVRPSQPLCVSDGAQYNLSFDDARLRRQRLFAFADRPLTFSQTTSSAPTI